MDDATDGDAKRRLALDRDFHFLSRDVGDLAVQRQLHGGLVAHVVDELILAGLTVVFQAAAHEPFAEAIEPAEAAAHLQVHELGMDDLFDRRIPAEAHVAQAGRENAHAARRNDRDLHEPVVDDQQFASFLPAAVENHLADRPRHRASGRDLLAGDHELSHGYVIRDAGDFLVIRLGARVECQ